MAAEPTTQGGAVATVGNIMVVHDYAIIAQLPTASASLPQLGVSFRGFR